MSTSPLAMVVVSVASFFGALGALFLKKAAHSIKLDLVDLITNTKLFLGVFFYVVATAMFIPALRYGELSTLYPLVATTYIWISIFSEKFLKEPMNRYKWIGIMFICLGVFLIGFGSAR